jgi:hypothetical protein
MSRRVVLAVFELIVLHRQMRQDFVQASPAAAPSR